MSEQSSGPDFKADVDALVEGAAGLFSNLREIFEKSRDEIARASRLGKTRLDLLQLEKDREHFLSKLGEITLGLMREGTVAHESLTELAGKIEALDARKAEYDAEIARVAEEQATAKAAGEDSAEQSPSEGSANDTTEAGGAQAAAADVEPPSEPETKKAPAKKAPAKKAATKKPATKKPKKDL